MKKGEAPFAWSGPSVQWGDYSNTCLDPVNDTDFWTIQEYGAIPTPDVPELRYGLWWGRIVPPAAWPRFTMIKEESGQLHFTFTTSCGHSYALEKSAAPFGSLWETITESIQGDGTNLERSIPNETASAAFYRLRLLP